MSNENSGFSPLIVEGKQLPCYGYRPSASGWYLPGFRHRSVTLPEAVPGSCTISYSFVTWHFFLCACLRNFSSVIPSASPIIIYIHQKQRGDSMERFIPYEKLSKKEKRKWDLAGRQTWGPLNPVTRKPESSRAYQRHRINRQGRNQYETA